jgi:serine protease Do
LSEEISDLVEHVLPSVVTWRGLDTALHEWSGSGFVIDDLGHLVTNHHVVDGMGETMTVTLHGGATARTAVLGSDPVTDLAVVLLESPGLPSMDIRTTPPRLGELCIAIGSPLGDFAESTSFGVGSGLDRSIPTQQGSWPLEHVIQTDAAVNHGNSGGPCSM